MVFYVYLSSWLLSYGGVEMGIHGLKKEVHFFCIRKSNNFIREFDMSADMSTHMSVFYLNGIDSS